MLKVIVKNGKIDKAIKVLKQKVRNTKQKEELNSRTEFTKKSAKKRQQKKAAIHREKKNRDNE